MSFVHFLGDLIILAEVVLISTCSSTDSKLELCMTDCRRREVILDDDDDTDDDTVDNESFDFVCFVCSKRFSSLFAFSSRYFAL